MINVSSVSVLREASVNAYREYMDRLEFNRQKDILELHKKKEHENIIHQNRVDVRV